VVLVHGGWDNSTGRTSVIEKLQRRGFPVIAPANPLRDLASDSEHISSVLDTIEGPIVLVGHFYGGAVIRNAARRSSVRARREDRMRSDRPRRVIPTLPARSDVVAYCRGE